MVDIPVLLASISNSIGIARAVREINFDQADLRVKMLELIDTLTESKIALTDAQEDLQEKDREIARLTAAFARTGELVQRQGYQFLKNTRGEPQGTPVCSRCLEVDGRIMLTTRHTGERGTVVCPQCKTVYTAARAFNCENWARGWWGSVVGAQPCSASRMNAEQRMSRSSRSPKSQPI